MVPICRMNTDSFEVFQTWDVWPPIRAIILVSSEFGARVNRGNSLQRSLPIDQYICPLITTPSLVLRRDIPLTSRLAPGSFDHTRVELKISIQIPLFRCPHDVVMNLSSTGVELGPLWVRIEWECLGESAILIRRRPYWRSPARECLRICVMEQRTGLQDTCLPTTSRPLRASSRIWCGQ